MIYSIEYYGTKYSVDFTDHTRGTRSNEFVPRDALVYPQLAAKLLRTALQYGLFSMRKKHVVVTARVGEDYAISFVVVLSEDDNLTVISILSHPFCHYDIYRTIRNRINLYSLVFPKVTVTQATELKQRQAELKKPKSFKKKGVPVKRLNYKKDSALHHKNELDSYKTNHDHKRKL